MLVFVLVIDGDLLELCLINFVIKYFILSMSLVMLWVRLCFYFCDDVYSIFYFDIDLYKIIC